MFANTATNEHATWTPTDTAQGSNIDKENEKSQELFERINTLVDEEKLYLKSDLTIHELGVRLKMNSKYLSQAINQREDLNFNKYINQKRIAHAKEILLNPNFSNYSLEGIGHESGFRSKSTNLWTRICEYIASGVQ